MDRSVPRLALYGLAALVVGVVLVAGATSTSAFATHNPSWDGTADLRGIAAEESSFEVVRNVSAYENEPANDTLAIVLSPSAPYGDDAARLRQFVDRGGTVLIAEDYRTNANPLLAAIGASARFDGRPVRDERNHERSPTLAEVTVVGGTPLTSGLETLVFNRGTVLEPGDATMLAHTTSAAYLDDDGDGTLDETETPAERPVMAVESVGDGRVVTLADPSLFINSMLEYGDNRELATRLVDRNDRVLFDVSHTPRIPPLAAALLVLRESLLVQVALGSLLVLAVAGRDRLGSLVDRLRRERGSGGDRSPLDADEIASAVGREHPSWDESRVERVAERALDRGAADDGKLSDGDHEGAASR